MQSSRNDTYQFGSLRIRVSPGKDHELQFELVRYNGSGWEVAPDNSDPSLQKAMRDAIQAPQPGLYTPTPWMGRRAHFPMAA